MEESGGREKYIREIEREGSDLKCNTGLLLLSGKMALTEKTTEAAGLREQLGQEDCGGEEGG